MSEQRSVTYDREAPNVDRMTCPRCRKDVSSQHSYIVSNTGRVRYCHDCGILFRTSRSKNSRLLTEALIKIEEQDRDYYEGMEA